MNIAICEDNVQDAFILHEHMESYLKSKNCHGEIHMFSSAEELLAAFSPGVFDLVFLDIYLPGMSGMDLARSIRASDPDCLLIFITVSPDFTMDGFLVQASGYLIKPISLHKLETTLHLCREMFIRNARVIEVPQNGGTVTMPLSQIDYIEIYGNNALFHMQKGVVETRLTLDEIEEKLGDDSFLRCHRSYIVNMNRVTSTGEQFFCMINGDKVPIRKNGKKEIRLAYTRFKAINSTGVVRV